MLTLTAVVAADSVGIDPAVWGPGAVIVGLMLTGVLVPGYLLKQERAERALEREERRRLQSLVEQLLPALEKSADINEKALYFMKDSADVIRRFRFPDREQ